MSRSSFISAEFQAVAGNGQRVSRVVAARKAAAARAHAPLDASRGERGYRCPPICNGNISNRPGLFSTLNGKVHIQPADFFTSRFAGEGIVACFDICMFALLVSRAMRYTFTVALQRVCLAACGESISLHDARGAKLPSSAHVRVDKRDDLCLLPKFKNRAVL
jgi:hypothetical protein